MSQHAKLASPHATYGEVTSPSVQYSDGPELYHPPPPSLQSQWHEQYTHTATPPKSTKNQRIMDLQRQTFWLMLVLVAVIIAAAIGGGVGGSLAVQNANSKSSQNTTVITVPASDVPASATPTPTSVSATSGAPTTTSAITGAVYTANAPINVLRIDSSCPSSGSLSVTVLGKTAGYTCSGQTDHPQNDIIGFITYSLQQWAEACAWYNIAQGKKTCVTVAHSAMMSQDYRAYNANCFLKSSLGNKVVNNDWTSLTLD